MLGVPRDIPTLGIKRERALCHDSYVLGVKPSCLALRNYFHILQHFFDIGDDGKVELIHNKVLIDC